WSSRLADHDHRHPRVERARARDNALPPEAPVQAVRRAFLPWMKRCHMATLKCVTAVTNLRDETLALELHDGLRDLDVDLVHEHRERLGPDVADQIDQHDLLAVLHHHREAV